MGNSHISINFILVPLQSLCSKKDFKNVIILFFYPADLYKY